MASPRNNTAGVRPTDNQGNFVQKPKGAVRKKTAPVGANYTKSGDLKFQISKDTRMYRLIVGEISVKDLDDDELARGQVKGKDGKFARPPAFIPHELAVAMKNELLRRAEDIFKQGLIDACRVYIDVLRDESLPADIRLKASTLVIDRIMGKTPEKVEAVGTAPWQIMLNQIVVRSEDEPSAATVVAGQATDVEPQE